jgi:hypothetical protein
LIETHEQAGSSRSNAVKSAELITAFGACAGLPSLRRPYLLAEDFVRNEIQCLRQLRRYRRP